MNSLPGDQGREERGGASSPPERRFLAVTRGTQHAAKHVSNDALMFRLVCDQLQVRGWIVYEVAENDLSGFLERSGRPAYIISMAQRPEHVDLLRECEEEGSRIVNSPRAVANCYRTTLVEMLRDTEIPFAQSLILQAGACDFETIADLIGKPFWLKRGDIHAAHENDVCKIEDAEGYRERVEDFRSRGISTLVAQEHLIGDVLKFYAVRGTEFFHAQDFESEESVAFDTSPLEAIADAAAARLGLTIYGGDLVLTSDRGGILIDINAWPSFGRVREAAAPNMAEAIVSSWMAG